MGPQLQPIPAGRGLSAERRAGWIAGLVDQSRQRHVNAFGSQLVQWPNRHQRRSSPDRESQSGQWPDYPQWPESGGQPNFNYAVPFPNSGLGAGGGGFGGFGQQAGQSPGAATDAQFGITASASPAGLCTRQQCRGGWPVQVPAQSQAINPAMMANLQPFGRRGGGRNGQQQELAEYQQRLSGDKKVRSATGPRRQRAVSNGSGRQSATTVVVGGGGAGVKWAAGHPPHLSPG